MNMRILAAVSAGVFACATAEAAPVLNVANGHYYDLVVAPPETTWTWQQAAAGAAASVYNGWTGYLVTVTSLQESDFIYNSVTPLRVWAGGNDDTVEGSWKWVTGPEAATPFWTGGPSGSSSTYARWDSREPNNGLGAGENFLVLNYYGNPAWNDMIPTTSLVEGYVVEYSGIPEPASLLLFVTGLAGFRAVRQRKRNGPALQK